MEEFRGFFLARSRLGVLTLKRRAILNLYAVRPEWRGSPTVYRQYRTVTASVRTLLAYLYICSNMSTSKARAKIQLQCRITITTKGVFVASVQSSSNIVLKRCRLHLSPPLPQRIPVILTRVRRLWISKTKTWAFKAWRHWYSHHPGWMNLDIPISPWSSYTRPTTPCCLFLRIIVGTSRLLGPVILRAEKSRLL